MTPHHFPRLFPEKVVGGDPHYLDAKGQDGGG